MRKAAAAMSVGEEMKIGLSRNRSAEAPSSGRSKSAHQPRSRPSQPIRKSITTSVPRMARSCARYQRKTSGICNSPRAARIGPTELMLLRLPSAPSVMIGSTRVRPPFFEPPLDGVEQRDHDQSRGHEHEHAEKDHVGLKRIAGVGDHVAEARRRRVELADDDPEQRAAGAVFQAGEDEGYGAWQDDARKDLHSGGAEAARHPHEARFARLDAGLGVDEDRDDGAEENDHDLGPDADAEPDDDEGQERYARHRVERVDEGADHVLQALGQTDREPERDRQRQRRAVAQDEFGRTDLDVVPKIAVVAQLPTCLCDLRGGGDEQRIDEAAAPERLPKQQHGDERAAADHEALVLEVEPCEALAPALAMRGQFEVCRNGHEQPDATTAL